MTAVTPKGVQDVRAMSSETKVQVKQSSAINEFAGMGVVWKELACVFSYLVDSLGPTVILFLLMLRSKRKKKKEKAPFLLPA